MASKGSSAERAKGHADRAARKVSPVLDPVARTGYVAKGVVYATVGLLAGQAALGVGGKTVGTGGALESVGSQPFGKVLIFLLALGLSGYALWKLVQGVMDPDGKGSGLGGIVRRAGYVGSALIHAGLAFSALEELFGTEGQSTTIDQWTARVMSQPYGRWLVVLLGLGVIGVGLYQLYAGLGARYRDDLKTYQMSDAGRWAMFSGRVGTAARAVVILVAGSFVLWAAYQADASQTRGLGGTLETLVQRPFGSYILGVVAAGLLVYAVFMLVVARYRNIEAT